LLYSRARNLAFTSRNIKSSWSKTRLFPFDLDRVLSEIQKLQAEAIILQTTNITADLILYNNILRTPVTHKSLVYIRTMINQGTALNSLSKYRFQTLANTAEKALADRAILLDENKLLFE
jgi:hypothetical protein